MLPWTLGCRYCLNHNFLWINARIGIVASYVSFLIHVYQLNIWQNTHKDLCADWGPFLCTVVSFSPLCYFLRYQSLWSPLTLIHLPSVQQSFVLYQDLPFLHCGSKWASRAETTSSPHYSLFQDHTSGLPVSTYWNSFKYLCSSLGFICKWQKDKASITLSWL